MSGKKGKGIDALLPSAKKVEEDEKKKEITVITSKGERKVLVGKEEIEKVIKIVKKKRNVSTTDLFTRVCMELLKETVPRFNASEEVGKIVREYYLKNNKEFARIVENIIDRIEEGGREGAGGESEA